MEQFARKKYVSRKKDTSGAEWEDFVEVSPSRVFLLNLLGESLDKIIKV